MSASTTAPRSTQTLQVWRGEDLRVVIGANEGDALSHADDLLPEDIYRLSKTARTHALHVHIRANPPFEIAAASPTGQPGAALHLDCVATLMPPDGQTIECLIMVETRAEHVCDIYTLPLAPLRADTDYTLIGVDRDTARQRFAQVTCASFTHGTRITMATGVQRAVEDLRPGDRVLTRDDGPQPIRWIGRHTARATGAFAPVLIKAGTLNNAADLVVSPDHRLFVYQRRDDLGTGRSELMIRARHLINGTTIQQLSGGFIDYFQMLLDNHQILYAEGIAAESTLLDTTSSALLPDEPPLDLHTLLPAHAKGSLSQIEVQDPCPNRGDIAETLRRSSLG